MEMARSQSSSERGSYSRCAFDFSLLAMLVMYDLNTFPPTEL